MLLLATLAFAQDVVSLEYVKAGQAGLATPALRVVVNTDLSKLRVSMRCGAVSVEHSAPHRAGERVELPIDAPVGEYSCKGTLGIVATDGSEGEMPLST